MTPLILHSSRHRDHDATPLVLSPANGFPPLVYRPLLQQLDDDLEIWLTEHRPLWRDQPMPPSRLNWQHLATDLIQQIEAQKLLPVVLLGHSLGAVLGIMAAQRRPDLFRQLILVDPVMLPSHKSYFLRWLPWSMKRRIPMIKKTLGRPEQFADRQAAFRFHRRAAAFRNMSDEALDAYIEHGFEMADGELKLRFGKVWEAAIYGSLPNVWPILKRLTVPTTAIRAEHSNTLGVPQWRRWQQLQPQHHFIELSGSEHLLPLTEPERLASVLNPIVSGLPIVR
ncbi:alpha/beta hydrolase [Neiella sp. HB171785]|uniref:Alpha/beta hydrolase n=1 Tax=Neiella litorisoli TaxID=2771431 RepID=A0A8J6QRI8_9GAMM|nr:alpha/beta hydrolase [Neiella litorisoli]MBD1390216.1 alpha/beta hydrolase [Neiella litorisoli]